MTRRRSKRSLATPPSSASSTCGADTATPTIASADGVFESANTCHASAMSITPSPMSETVIPVQRMRKSRPRSGSRRFVDSGISGPGTSGPGTVAGSQLGDCAGLVSWNRSVSSRIVAIRCSISSSVFDAVTCTRKPTSCFGTSGYAASVT